MYGFPYSLCISVNEAVVHGFPNSNELKEGDIVSVDCGVNKNGFHADSAYTYAVGEISSDIEKLLSVTKKSLFAGIEKAVVGNRIGDIANAIQRFNEDEGYGIVRELVGHGLGKKMHEDPEMPNYGRRGRGKKFLEGMTVAIEPMVNLGTRRIEQLSDRFSEIPIKFEPRFGGRVRDRDASQTHGDDEG